MKDKLVVQFLRALGVHDTEVSDKWVKGKCPLAPFKHKNGTDNKPSFGVSLETGGFNCFTCSSGTGDELVQMLEMYSQQVPGHEHKFDFAAAREALDGIENVFEPLGEYAPFVDEGQKFREWPEWYLDRFHRWHNHPRAVWYLTEGRVAINCSEPVDPAVATAMDLLYDETYDRIVAPYRTLSGRLAGARGRTIEKDSPYLPHFDYTWEKANNAALVWYNEQCLEAASDARMPVIVVEGQFDALNVMRVYPYVVAGLTAKSSAKKIEKLQNCDGVLTMLDHDPTGEHAFDRYKKFLLGKVRLGRMTYPDEFKDPAKLPLAVLQEVFADLL